MAVFFGNVQSGFSVSSAFQLTRGQRALSLGVASYQAGGWFLAFAVSSNQPFARVIADPALGGLATPVFSGANGAWTTFVWPPTAFVRVEATANLTATVSFALIELGRFV